MTGGWVMPKLVNGWRNLPGPVHFIHLGGDLQWQHWRAMKTARVHGPRIILWTVEDSIVSQMPGLSIERFSIPDWLRDHPIGLANVKDYYAYALLATYGGIYLDMDTISLRSAWDLLTSDICMSTEFPPGEEAGKPHNTAVLLSEPDAPMMYELWRVAEKLLLAGEDTWGALGPHLISDMAARIPDQFSPAPYRALNGWSYHMITDYYANPRDPGEETRVIHLYSSDHLAEFYSDRWMPDVTSSGS